MSYQPNKIDIQKFREVLQTNFSSGILTLVSIVQGVTLAIATQQGFDALIDHGFSYVLAFHFITAMFYISGMFYFYFYFISTSFVPPTIIQVSIVFLLGLSEMAASYSIGFPKYFILMTTSVFLAAIIAFINTAILLNRNMYADDFSDTYKLVRQENTKNIRCFFLLFIVGIILFLDYPKVSGYAVGHEVLFFFLTLPIYVYAIVTSHTRFMKPLLALSNKVGD